MPEGRVRNNSGTLKSEYMITDHQSNVRVSFEDNGSGVAVVKQENSYYPFGLVMNGSAVPTPTAANNNLYNAGAEWQNDFGDLPDYYNTFYRNYDAAIGRFVAVDPKADVADSWTTYQYGYNSPGIFNDPLGDISDAQWQFVLGIFNSGKIYSNYYVNDGSDGYMELDDRSAFYAGAAYIDKFNGWGTNGSPFSYKEAVNTFNKTAAPGMNIGSYKLQNHVVATRWYHDSSGSPVTVDNLSGSVSLILFDHKGGANQGGPGLQSYEIYNRTEANGANYFGARFIYTVDVSKLGFQSYQWIQIVNTTPLSVVHGKTLSNPVVDGTYDNNGHNVNYPFYMTSSDRYLQGNYAVFGDEPGTTKTNYSFSAQTTLVGINGVILTPIMSINWGYSVNNGVTSLSPMTTTNYNYQYKFKP